MPRPLRVDSVLRAAPALAPAEPVILRPVHEERLGAARRRLGMLFATYAAALQLAPSIERLTTQWPLHWRIAWLTTPAALALAALRGVPLGYFLAFALRRRGALVASLVAGGALGLVLELCEWIADRPLTPIDIVATALSAAGGAVAFLLLARRLRAAAANDAVLLAPDLPLVGGAYVAAPLLWLSATSAASLDETGPRWALLLLVLYGASLIGSARASRGPAGGGLIAHAGAAASWAAVGLAPFAGVAPRQVLLFVSSASVFAALHPVLLGARGRDRRVEGAALRRALPLLGLYYALTVLAPLAAIRAGQPGAWPTWAVVAASVPGGGWSELAAAMSVMGYALTELLGRREDTGLTSWRLVGPCVGVLSALATALRVGASPHGSTAGMTARVLIGWLLCMAAARAGAGLYDLQRRHARAHAKQGPRVRALATVRRAEASAA